MDARSHLRRERVARRLIVGRRFRHERRSRFSHGKFKIRGNFTPDLDSGNGFASNALQAFSLLLDASIVIFFSQISVDTRFANSVILEHSDIRIDPPCRHRSDKFFLPSSSIIDIDGQANRVNRSRFVCSPMRGTIRCKRTKRTELLPAVHLQRRVETQSNKRSARFARFVRRT